MDEQQNLVFEEVIVAQLHYTTETDIQTLISITLEDGKSLKVTPNHVMIVVNSLGSMCKIPANKCTQGQNFITLDEGGDVLRSVPIKNIDLAGIAKVGVANLITRSLTLVANGVAATSLGESSMQRYGYLFNLVQHVHDWFGVRSARVMYKIVEYVDDYYDGK